jgi:hypothetical protein
MGVVTRLAPCHPEGARTTGSEAFCMCACDTTYLEVALVALSPRGHPVPGGAGRICCSDSTLVAS